jgi:hypothetical protein
MVIHRLRVPYVRIRVPDWQYSGRNDCTVVTLKQFRFARR